MEFFATFFFTIFVTCIVLALIGVALGFLLQAAVAIGYVFMGILWILDKVCPPFHRWFYSTSNKKPKKYVPHPPTRIDIKH